VRHAFAVALGVALLAGCGGGGSKPLTRQEYASKADAICSKYNAKVKALGTPSNLPDLTKVVDETLPIIDDAIAELKKLKPPAGEQGVASQWLVQVQALADDLRDLRDKAKANDLQAIQGILPKAQVHTTRSNQLASQLGMTVCNSS
jgi:hypothetical protein